MQAEQGGEPHRVVMEGGALDVNGQGTLLTTEECLLGEVQARNPGLTREAIETIFADYLGVRHVVWLGRGSMATTRTAMSTTWRGLSIRRRSSQSSSRAPTTRITSR